MREPRTTRVIGIDPGTRVCGWGVVEAEGSRLRAVAAGAVRARAQDPIERRLLVIAEGLEEIVRLHAPSEGAVEEVFHGRDARASVRLGEGRGAALVVLGRAGLPVSHYANNQVKRAVTGAGRAEKERVRGMVRAILGLAADPDPLDASDALALAICHLHHRRLAAAGGAGGPSKRFADAVRAMGKRSVRT